MTSTGGVGVGLTWIVVGEMPRGGVCRRGSDRRNRPRCLLVHLLARLLSKLHYYDLLWTCWTTNRTIQHRDMSTCGFVFDFMWT